MSLLLFAGFGTYPYVETRTDYPMKCDRGPVPGGSSDQRTAAVRAQFLFVSQVTGTSNRYERPEGPRIILVLNAYRVPVFVSHLLETRLW
jgi:hypothetical protein